MNTVILKRKSVYAAVILCLTIVVCILFVLSCRTVSIYPKNGEIKINRKTHGLENEIFTYNGYIYVSAGEILPILGCKLNWDNDTETLYAEKNGRIYSIAAESNVMKKDKKTIEFSRQAKMKNDRIYLNLNMMEMITGKRFKLKGTVTKVEKDTAVFYADKTEFLFNGTKNYTDDVPVNTDGKIMIPANSVLMRCGYKTSEENGILSAERFGVKTEISENRIISDGKKSQYTALVYHERLFISMEAFSFISGAEVELNGKIRESAFGKRDCLENTVSTNEYRKKEYFGTYNGVTIADECGMELLGISEKSAEKYAEVINKIADTLANVNVYDIIVPSAGEFYAPEDMKVSQLIGIKTAYKALNGKVTPINAYAALQEKADERIFFKTDHHWTQRGAYYAYREFANQKGMYLPPLNEFKTEKLYDYLGSFAAFTSGTYGEILLTANADELEKFYPSVNAECAFYSDCGMKNETGTGKVVSEYRSYTSFIGGDHPVTKIETDVKNGKKLLIIKESYGNAFTTWAVNNYETIYAVDPREFNGFGGKTESFSLKEFYGNTKFDDLIVITYPVSTISEGIRNSILKMTE